MYENIIWVECLSISHLETEYWCDLPLKHSLFPLHFFCSSFPTSIHPFFNSSLYKVSTWSTLLCLISVTAILKYLLRGPCYQGRHSDGKGLRKVFLYSSEETMWGIAPEILWHPKHTRRVTVKWNAYVHITIYEIFVFTEILWKYKMYNGNI